jgi:hypothetical protein
MLSAALHAEIRLRLSGRDGGAPSALNVGATIWPLSRSRLPKGGAGATSPAVGNKLDQRLSDSYEAILAASKDAWLFLIGDPDRIDSIGHRSRA